MIDGFQICLQTKQKNLLQHDIVSFSKGGIDMKHTIYFLCILLSLFIFCPLIFIEEVVAQPQRPERPREAVTSPTIGIENTDIAPKIKVWTDKGDNTNGNRPVYYVGEQIYISFQVDKDSYVTVYDIDGTGNVNIIFPNPCYKDNFVRGGRIYTIPSSMCDYNLVLQGPPGEESLLAIASNYVYYHWQYGISPPPIWSSQWGSPNTWGHPGGNDYSIVSQRFQKRLQIEPAGSPDLTVEYIKTQIKVKTPALVSIQYAGGEIYEFKGKSHVDPDECRFSVIVPPY